jgi:hypothetical protein
MKQAPTVFIAYVTKDVLKKLHILEMENIFFSITDFDGDSGVSDLIYSYVTVNISLNDYELNKKYPF